MTNIRSSEPGGHSFGINTKAPDLLLIPLTVSPPLPNLLIIINSR